MNIIENKRLIDKYPFLKEDNIFSFQDSNYETTKLDEMPEGWREAFSIRMCEEIKQALIKHNLLEEYKILQIKEKFGELRCYGNFYVEEVEEIFDKYSKKSHYICIRCGGRAKKITKRWISPWCEDCLNATKYEGETIPVIQYWERWNKF